jgi:glycosyltransferase involved in cell wall biosynthesis
MRIAIAWNGLPFYAARLIRAGIERVEAPVDVIGSKPSVPIEGMEDELGQSIHWMDNSKPQSWDDIGLPVPDLLIHTGWRYTGFNTLGHEVRQHGGGVVSMIDNRWKNSVRQWIGAVVFRLRYRRWFDAVWVPGDSGRRLCRFLGMPDEDIHEGMYGADPEVFTEGLSLPEREKTLLFVGQLIPRKNISHLVEAFRQFRDDHPGWTLKIVGEGEVSIPSEEPGIEQEGFLQPEEVAQRMRESRFLLLPSREDHWGLVAHEAALCGCGLLVSDQVGAAADLVNSGNGVVFEVGSVDALEEALREAAEKGQKWLCNATTESRRLAENFGPDRWGQTFEEIVTEYG